jgi:uncharacterized protein YbaA (DUF1428 family)
MNGYVDLYLLPVVERTIEAYREQASTFGAVAREHGALAYREVRADHLVAGFAAEVREGEVLTAAIAEFRSREHRDEVMAKVMEDPRVTALMGEGEQLADMSRMRYGGFTTFVEA